MAFLSLLVTAYVIYVVVFTISEIRKAVDAVRQLIHTIRRLRAVYHVLRIGVSLQGELRHKVTQVWYEREYGKPSDPPEDAALNSEASSGDAKPIEEKSCDYAVQS